MQCIRCGCEKFTVLRTERNKTINKKTSNINPLLKTPEKDWMPAEFNRVTYKTNKTIIAEMLNTQSKITG